MNSLRTYACPSLLFFIFFIFSFQLQAAPEKVSLYTYHTHSPFVTEGASGLSYELASFLSKWSLGEYEFKVVLTSRPRINKLIKGHSLGIVPWINPIWFKDRDETKYLWSNQTLMNDANAIISHRDLSLDYKGPKSMSDLILGGIKGHVYSDIDDFIKKGNSLRRVNADNHAQNMTKIRQGDIDVMLMPLSSALYSITQQSLEKELFVSPTPHSSYTRRLLVINNNNKLLDFIDDILKTQEDEWMKTIRKYQ